jgi:hypothetical protein
MVLHCCTSLAPVIQTATAARAACSIGSSTMAPICLLACSPCAMRATSAISVPILKPCWQIVALLLLLIAWASSRWLCFCMIEVTIPCFTVSGHQHSLEWAECAPIPIAPCIRSGIIITLLVLGQLKLCHRRPYDPFKPALLLCPCVGTLLAFKQGSEMRLVRANLWASKARRTTVIFQSKACCQCS